MSNGELWPGKPYPLGATWDGKGVNFALFSEYATKVELLLFENPNDSEPQRVIPLPERTALVWHGYIPDLKPSQLYAYRVHGPFEPERGHRFNPAKVLLDPYAKAMAGTFQWDEALFGYRRDDSDEDLSRNEQDSCPLVPKCVVIDPTFDWEDDCSPKIPWNETIIYETHVKGLTVRHPDVEEDKRGSYAALAQTPIIDYLKDLGITAVELMPIHYHAPEGFLVEKGLVNYWGYSTIGYFAPDGRYSCAKQPGEQVREFKTMVKALHKAGIEVILDVVYNHTAEGNERGPTLCFRGIDNVSYYQLHPENPRHYLDFTGTGNSLRMSCPQVTQLIMDSLRYWVQEMHVDGFRFDLASALARELYEVNELATFFHLIQQDPVLSQVKLIAEPWDVGEGGYQVGNFPPLWTEWNGKYRDTIRCLWKGDMNRMAELGYRLTGSSDLYQDDGRRPYASINFVTCHDGFNLNDLVSYNQKHNEANQEDNRDGSDHNLSWNCGAEGPTDDPEINVLRERQKRNFLATLFLSQGVPMLLGGDEIGRTQGGNNNTYCQDNEINWYDWKLDKSRQALLTFTRRLIQLRREHPALRRKKFFQGRKLLGSDVKDIGWLKSDGSSMNEQDWDQSSVITLGMMLAGDAITETDGRGRRIVDDTFLILLNAHAEAVDFKLPPAEEGWEQLLYTFELDLEATSRLEGSAVFKLEDRSLALFRTPSRNDQ